MFNFNKAECSIRRIAGFQERDIRPPSSLSPSLPLSFSRPLALSPSSSPRSRSSRSLSLLTLLSHSPPPSPSFPPPHSALFLGPPLSPANKTLRRLRRRPLLTQISPGVSSPSDVRGGTLPPTPPHPLLPPPPLPSTRLHSLPPFPSPHALGPFLLSSLRILAPFPVPSRSHGPRAHRVPFPRPPPPSHPPIVGSTELEKVWFAEGGCSGDKAEGAAGITSRAQWGGWVGRGRAGPRGKGLP